MRLSESGLIASMGPAITQGEIEQALGAASQILGGCAMAELGKSYRRDARSHSSDQPQDRVHPWPADLFFPVDGGFHHKDSIALPGGQIGEYEVLYATRRATGQSRLESAQRRVVTRLDRSERTAIEQWRLDPVESP